MTVGSILRGARSSRGISQLDLALSLGVSQRHMSFVESGRSRPSRDLILNWMNEVGATVSERNAALLEAGYAAAGRGPAQLEEPACAHHRVLDAHDPLPGLIFDADWRMIRTNAGMKWLFGQVMAGFLASDEGSRSDWDMISGVAHPGGLLSKMIDPETYGARLLRQLRIEELTRPSLNSRVNVLEQALHDRLGHRSAMDSDAIEPGLSLCFDTEHGRLSFFTVQCMFRLPQDAASTSVRAGLWFPADGTTRSVLKQNVRMDDIGQPTFAPKVPRLRSA